MNKVDWSDKNRLQHLINTSVSHSDVLKKLGLTPASNAVTLRKYIKRYGFDVSHFDPRVDRPQHRNGATATKLDQILVEHSTYQSRFRLKIRLLQANMLKNECGECGLLPKWNDRPLTLQLDHKNGIQDDNRLHNLRLLCPNCHSQTFTYAGRNKK